jgi:D-cysteine desulfhydrase
LPIDGPPRAANTERVPPLAARFPGLAGLGRVPLGRWPTPLEPAESLGRAIGAELWLKRDDLAAEPYGGSKIRKLEYWLAEAERQGLRSIVTFGGAGSHHALATAIFARQRDLRSTLFLLPQPPSDDTRTTILGALAHGAEIHLAGDMPGARRKAALMREAFVIPPGGSGPLGNLGYIEAALELDAQIAAGIPAPDVIVIALGTMGTAVGLAIGLAVTGRPIPILAVRASNVPTSSPAALAAAHAETVAFCRAHDASFPALTLDPAAIAIESRHLGAGYAQPTPAGRRARRLAATHDLALDDTYTAKAFAALVTAARAAPGRRNLFWQTHDARPLPGIAAPAEISAALRFYVR